MSRAARFSPMGSNPESFVKGFEWKVSWADDDRFEARQNDDGEWFGVCHVCQVQSVPDWREFDAVVTFIHKHQAKHS